MIDDAYLTGKPTSRATIRSTPDDFKVDEQLGFEPDGEGEHWLVRVQKTGMNTVFVAEHIARCCGVRARDVSYCGPKDRHAVTTQWFCVHLPGQADPSDRDLEMENLKVLAASRHRRKLRRGAHAGNQFSLILRDCEGGQLEFERRLAFISQHGFANYFGAQRFGHQGKNIDRARELFLTKPKGRKRNKNQGIYLSAARSCLFNQVLSQRIVEDKYNRIDVGDVLMLNGSNSVFAVDEPDDALQSRLREGDVHITGPMWGGGKLMVSGAVREWEENCVEENQDLCNGLANHGLKHERRAFRAFAKNLQWKWLDEGTLRVEFGLDNGCYATSLLRELANLNDAYQPGQA